MNDKPDNRVIKCRGAQLYDDDWHVMLEIKTGESTVLYVPLDDAKQLMREMSVLIHQAEKPE